MSIQNELRRHPANRLDGARDMAHKAVQLVTKAARANLTAEPDDSHSNLGWNGELGAFVSHPLPGNSGDLFVGLNISQLKLMIVSDGQAGPSLELAGSSETGPGEWLDEQLAHQGADTIVPQRRYRKTTSCKQDGRSLRRHE